MSSEICPHCEKSIKHRKLCPVLRKQKQKENEIFYKKKMEEKKIETEKLNNEINKLEKNHPKVVKYIRNLEIKIQKLEREMEFLEYEIRFKPQNSYDSDY